MNKKGSFDYKTFIMGIIISVPLVIIVKIYAIDILIIDPSIESFNQKSILITSIVSVVLFFLWLFLSFKTDESIDAIKQSTGVYRDKKKWDEWERHISLDNLKQFNAIKQRIDKENISDFQKKNLVEMMKSLIDDLPLPKQEEAKKICEKIEDSISK
jgi:hypothetical protein